MTNYEKDYAELIKEIVNSPEMPYKDNRTESRTMMSMNLMLEIKL